MKPRPYLYLVRPPSELSSDPHSRDQVITIVAFPLDEILKWTSPAAIDLGVQDGFNDVFDFAVNFNRRQRILNSVRNSVRSDRFEHGGMKDRMNFAQSWR